MKTRAMFVNNNELGSTEVLNRIIAECEAIGMTFVSYVPIDRQHGFLFMNQTAEIDQPETEE